MNRSQRALRAKETVAICEAGSYVAPTGAHVSIAEQLAQARAGTVLYSPEHPPAASHPSRQHQTVLEARNETTFEALQRLTTSAASHVACLNFASAKNPGGGFLGGALAQEEALAGASALYPCLLEAPEFYARQRANHSTLYLDLAIFSPRVPFFRDDSGALLEQPLLASVITAPAPNAGAVVDNEPQNVQQIEPTLRRRAELVLSIASTHQVERLVLGAWGCGVFRNDPELVAGIFAELLTAPGRFAGAFARVVFAVLDRGKPAATYQAFADRFGS